MSSLEMTGVMGILAVWEMDRWKNPPQVKCHHYGLFQSGNSCGVPASCGKNTG